MLAADRFKNAVAFSGFDESVLITLGDEIAKYVPMAEIPLGKVFGKVLDLFHFKPEVMKMMKQIIKNAELSSLDKPAARGTCRICYIRPIEVELRPCKHRLACLQCSPPPGGVCFLCKTTVWEAKRLQKKHEEVASRRSYLGRSMPNPDHDWSMPQQPDTPSNTGLKLPGAIGDIFQRYDD